MKRALWCTQLHGLPDARFAAQAVAADGGDGDGDCLGGHVANYSDQSNYPLRAISLTQEALLPFLKVVLE